MSVVPVKPADEIKILLALYSALGSGPASTGQVDYDVKALAAKMRQHLGKCLVVSGHNNLEIQMLVNAINQQLESYGSTLDMNTTIQAGNDDEKQFGQIVNDLNAGKIDAIMFYQNNPVYDFYDGEQMRKAIKKAKLSISFATAKNETAEECTFILPDNHYLESWNDGEFLTGHYSLAQPAIRNIFDTRQFQDTLLAWMESATGFYPYLQKYWEDNIFPMQSRHQAFAPFWKKHFRPACLKFPQKTISHPHTTGYKLRQLLMRWPGRRQKPLKLSFRSCKI